MKVTEFNYDLPEELIAQTPLEKRDESRLMILNRQEKTIEHNTFKNIIEYLKPIREKRKYYEENPEIVDEILINGTKKAKEVASKTMKKVKPFLKYL